jgi:hypothetical protein
MAWLCQRRHRGDRAWTIPATYALFFRPKSNIGGSRPTGVAFDLDVELQGAITNTQQIDELLRFIYQKVFKSVAFADRQKTRPKTNQSTSFVNKTRRNKYTVPPLLIVSAKPSGYPGYPPWS